MTTSYSTRRQEWLVPLIGLGLLLLTGYFSVGFNQSDEHFQILEFAHMKLGLSSPDQLAWEYHNEMRPALQPALAYGLYRTLELFGGDDPFLTVLILRWLSALLSFTAMLAIYRLYRDRITDPRLRYGYLLLCFLLWFHVYNGVRFSSENWSGRLFVLGFVAYLLPQWKSRNWIQLGVGFLLGLSFVTRHQAGLMVLGFGLWLLFLNRPPWRRLVLLSIGGLAAIGLGSVLDYWLYGEWTITAWNYLDLNLLQNKVAEFGLAPWHFYLSGVIKRAGPPLGLVLIPAVVLGLLARPRSAVTWACIPFLAVHLWLSRREVRFLYPLIGFVPILLVRATEWVQQRTAGDWLRSRLFRVGGWILALTNGVMLLIICFRPATSEVNIYERIYERYHPAPITLYSVRYDPYALALEVQYYRSPQLQVRELPYAAALDTISAKRFLLITKNEAAVDSIAGRKTLLYRTYPAWFRAIDFNDWQSRTRQYFLYEIDRRGTMR